MTRRSLIMSAVAMALRKERLSGISSDSTVAMDGPQQQQQPARPQAQTAAPRAVEVTTQEVATAPTTVKVRPFRTLAQPLPGTTPETTRASTTVLRKTIR